MVTTKTILSPNKYDGRSEPITWIAMHTAESPEQEGDAVAVADYFSNSSVQASSHWCVDDDTQVRVVNDGDTAWTIGIGNPWTLNIELAGYAAQTPAQWDDAYSRKCLDVAAQACADWVIKYEIPVKHLSDTEIRAYNKGFLGHVDYNRVFNAGDHTDPGPNFPWDYFLGRVNYFLGSNSVPTTPVKSRPVN